MKSEINWSMEVKCDTFSTSDCDKVRDVTKKNEDKIRGQTMWIK